MAGGSSGIPLLLAAGLAALAVLGPAREQPVLARTLVTTAIALGAWNLRLIARARRNGRALSLQTVLKAQHYLQACAQGAVLVYWGWYWRPVYDYAHLIVAQLLFAYAFDMLLSWTRRGVYTLGFGPFPVIFSINLFLWFRPDYFFFQFLMVAVGFAAKELLQWDKDGRRAHIFNPSSFPLAVFGLALLLSGRSGLTWGQEIATTQFYPPYMYLFIFLIGLPGQLAFGVTTMTCSAVVVSLSLRTRLLRDHRRVFLLRLVHPDRGVPRDAPAVHRSLHLAAHGVRPRDLRRPLRRQHCRALPAAWDHGSADVLRQAPPGADPQPFGEGHRPNRGPGTGVRPDCASPERWHPVNVTLPMSRSGR